MLTPSLQCVLAHAFHAVPKYSGWNQQQNLSCLSPLACPPNSLCLPLSITDSPFPLPSCHLPASEFCFLHRLSSSSSRSSWASANHHSDPWSNINTSITLNSLSLLSLVAETPSWKRVIMRENIIRHYLNIADLNPASFPDWLHLILHCSTCRGLLRQDSVVPCVVHNTSHQTSNTLDEEWVCVLCWG